MVKLNNTPRNPLVYYIKSGVLYKFGANIKDTDACAIIKVYKKDDDTFNDESKAESITVVDGTNTKKYYLDVFVTVGDTYSSETEKFTHITHGAIEITESLPDYFKRICKEAIIKNIGDRYDNQMSKADNYKAICRDGNKFSAEKIEDFLGVPYWMIKNVKTGITVTEDITIPLAQSDYNSYLDEYCTIKLTEYANELKKKYDVTTICVKKKTDGTCDCSA